MLWFFGSLKSEFLGEVLVGTEISGEDEIFAAAFEATPGIKAPAL